MATIEMFQVDAFAARAFTGNPAAVCVLDAFPEDGLLQAIAEENNLSETAFAVPKGNAYALRWFTPRVEVDLCGHATLATAHVLLNELGVSQSELRFETRSGELRVRRSEQLTGALRLDLPAVASSEVAPPRGLAAALGAPVLQVYKGRYLICELESESTVRELKPNFAKLAELGSCVSVTARGEQADFVSRFFAAPVGVAEDPVTGSAHCELTPYWANKLGKTALFARQLSARGGALHCELSGDRVVLTGTSVTVLRGTFFLPSP